MDASELTSQSFRIRGLPYNPTDPAVRRVRLAPGRYQLGGPVLSPDAWFTVTESGRVETDPEATFLNVRDGNRLELTGVDVTVDPGRVDMSSFGVGGVRGDLSGTEPHTLRVLPAEYQLHVYSIWTDARFTVASDGTVGYPDGVSYLGGRGERTLRLKGVEVTIDAGNLDAPTFAVRGVLGPRDAGEPQTVRMLPSSGRQYYRLHDGRTWSDVGFTVTGDGEITYLAGHADYLSGAGTSTLTIRTPALPPEK